jgi:hypothetical protein
MILNMIWRAVTRTSRTKLYIAVVIAVLPVGLRTNMLSLHLETLGNLLGISFLNLFIILIHRVGAFWLLLNFD